MAEQETKQTKTEGSIDYNDSAEKIAKDKAKAADQDAERLRAEHE